MKTKMTSYTQDSLPLLSKEQREHLLELAAQPDSEIDTTDSPEMPDERWVSARRRVFRPQTPGLVSSAASAIDSRDT